MSHRRNNGRENGHQQKSLIELANKLFDEKTRRMSHSEIQTHEYNAQILEKKAKKEDRNSSKADNLYKEALVKRLSTAIGFDHFAAITSGFERHGYQFAVAKSYEKGAKNASFLQRNLLKAKMHERAYETFYKVSVLQSAAMNAVFAADGYARSKELKKSAEMLDRAKQLFERICVDVKRIRSYKQVGNLLQSKGVETKLIKKYRMFSSDLFEKDSELLYEELPSEIIEKEKEEERKREEQKEST